MLFSKEEGTHFGADEAVSCFLTLAKPVIGIFLLHFMLDLLKTVE
jgi:hypothetical protein